MDGYFRIFSQVLCGEASKVKMVVEKKRQMGYEKIISAIIFRVSIQNNIFFIVNYEIGNGLERLRNRDFFSRHFLAHILNGHTYYLYLLIFRGPSPAEILMGKVENAVQYHFLPRDIWKAVRDIRFNSPFLIST